MPALGENAKAAGLMLVYSVKVLLWFVAMRTG